MKPRMTVPVYHDTRDARVIQWVNRNLTTHDLAQAQNMCKIEAKGNIRIWLLAALIVPNLLWLWVI